MYAFSTPYEKTSPSKAPSAARPSGVPTAPAATAASLAPSDCLLKRPVARRHVARRGLDMRLRIEEG
jgi:hypothetical protein